VSEEPPPGQQIESIEESRQIVHVHGESARPEVFFGQLLYLLEQAGRASVPAKAKAPLHKGGEDQPRPIEEYSDAEYLREQVRRSQQILYGLQQRIIPGEGDQYLGAQIAYQRHTIAKLEDQLRGLAESRERLLKLATQVNDAVQQARQVDPRTKNFVDNQLGTITDEFSRDEPNQDIVSASTSTMVVLAERVGPEVVDSDVVRELASFAYRSVG
jgi:hypothetical protein